MRVLIFGASITQGFWDTQGGWAQRLRTHYDKKQTEDITADYPTIFNLGVSADTTEDILNRFEAETKARRRDDMAFLLSCGINDSAIQDGQERSNPQKFEAELNELIAKAKKYSDKILVIGMTPCEEELTNPVPEYWHKDLRYTNDRIMAFERVARKVCADKKIPRVELSETMKDKLGQGDRLLIDGLHPNDSVHELMFKLILPEVEKLLR